MKTAIALFCAVLAANSLRADIYTEAKRQARDAATKVSNADQGKTAFPTPSSPAAPSPNNPAPDPVLEATLRNIANLRADFAGLGNATDTNAVATQTQLLMNDLAAAALGAKPSPASVSQLAGHLTTAFAGNEKLRAWQQKLAQDVHAIFNSSHLSPAQQQTIFDDVQKILQNGGAPAADTTNVVNDIKAIAVETK